MAAVSAPKSRCPFRHIAITRRYAGFMLPKRRRKDELENQFAIRKRDSDWLPAGNQSSSPIRLSPSELSAAIRTASQGSNVGDLRMWRSYAEATLFHAGHLKPKQMAFITNGFARAQVPDKDVFRRLADYAMDQVHDFEPRDSALLLNAYARLEFRDLDLFQRFSKAITAGDSTGFGEQQLSLVANAFARLELKDLPLFNVLGTWISKRVYEFTPQGVSAVANAYAKVQIRDVELFKALGESVDRLLTQLDPRLIANLLNAYAKLGIHDKEVLRKLVSLVPPRVHDFGPVEVASTANAVTKLGIGDHRTLLALGTTAQERADEFKPRQLAQVVHAFSTLNATYSRLLENLGPRVVDIADTCDDKSLVMLLCAYARAGVAPGIVIRTLVNMLDPRIDGLEAQVLVQLLYACGRLSLSGEKFTHQLAGVLLSRVKASWSPALVPGQAVATENELAPQHVANCLFASSKLGLCSSEIARLTETLQLSLTHKKYQFEPQQCANILHALAAIHGVGAAPPASRDAMVNLPGTVVPAMVDRVLKEQRWVDHPQLLASVAVSCARLRHESAPLLDLVSRTVRQAKCMLSKQGIADLLAAFSVSQRFDLDMFTWAIGQFVADAPGSTPMTPLSTCINALDYANQSVTNEGFTEFPSGNGDEDFEMGMLFPTAPASFQHQAVELYKHVGLAALVSAQTLPSQNLTDLVPAYARAGLLHMLPPFDLLGDAACKVGDEEEMPTQPLSFFSSMGQAFPATDDVSSSSVATPAKPPPEGEKVLDLLLSAVVARTSAHRGRSGTIAMEEAETVALLLSRYAAMLPKVSSATTGWQGSKSRSRYQRAKPSVPDRGFRQFVVPTTVLDPILRKLGDQLVELASELPFSELNSALTILLETGVCPRFSLDVLIAKVEKSFPSDARNPDDFVAVANLCRGVALDVRVQRANVEPLRERLVIFAENLASLANDSISLGDRPLRDLSHILNALNAVGSVDLAVVDGLLRVALRCSGGILDKSSNCPKTFDDLQTLAISVLSLAESINSKENASGAFALDVLGIVTAQLAHRLHMSSDPLVAKMIPALLGALADAPASVHRRCVHPCLMERLADRLAVQAQELGPEALSSCLFAFARLGFPSAADSLLDQVERVESAGNRAISAALGPTCGGDAPEMSTFLNFDSNLGDRLCRALGTAMRAALVWQRRLDQAEAAKVAYFCALSLDAQSFAEADREEARHGLFQLIEQLCFDSHRWGSQERRLLGTIGALMRAEFPELLRGSQLSRSAKIALEELRHEGSQAFQGPR